MDKDIYETNDQCVNKNITPAHKLIQLLIANEDNNLVDQIRKELDILKNKDCDLADGLAYLSSFIDDLIKKPLNIAKALPETTVLNEKLALKFINLKELDKKISLLLLLEKSKNLSFRELLTDDSLKKICPFNSAKKKMTIGEIDKTIEANVEMKKNAGQLGRTKVKCGYLINYLDIIDKYINSMTEYKYEYQELISAEDKNRDLNEAIQESSIILVDNFQLFTKSVRDNSILFCLNLIKAYQTSTNLPVGDN